MDRGRAWGEPTGQGRADGPPFRFAATVFDEVTEAM
jgi:hypothetical protein